MKILFLKNENTSGGTTVEKKRLSKQNILEKYCQSGKWNFLSRKLENSKEIGIDLVTTF